MVTACTIILAKRAYQEIRYLQTKRITQHIVRPNTDEQQCLAVASGSFLGSLREIAKICNKRFNCFDEAKLAWSDGCKQIKNGDYRMPFGWVWSGHQPKVNFGFYQPGIALLLQKKLSEDKYKQSLKGVDWKVALSEDAFLEDLKTFEGSAVEGACRAYVVATDGCCTESITRSDANKGPRTLAFPQHKLAIFVRKNSEGLTLVSLDPEGWDAAPKRRLGLERFLAKVNEALGGKPVNVFAPKFKREKAYWGCGTFAMRDVIEFVKMGSEGREKFFETLKKFTEKSYVETNGTRRMQKQTPDAKGSLFCLHYDEVPGEFLRGWQGRASYRAWKHRPLASKGGKSLGEYSEKYMPQRSLLSRLFWVEVFNGYINYKMIKYLDVLSQRLSESPLNQDEYLKLIQGVAAKGMLIGLDDDRLPSPKTD